MKKMLRRCLDSVEIFGNELRCRFDANNYPILHDHDYWEIMVILEGTYHQTVNGQEFIMPKNTALLLRPGDVHYVEPGDSVDTHLNVMVNCDFMRETCDFFEDTLYSKLQATPPAPLFLSSSQRENISDIARELQLYPLRRLKRMLLSFFLDLYQIQFDMKSVDYPPAFQKLFEVLSQPDSVKMGVKDLAALTGYSYSHFAKLFKAFTGVSANEYLTGKKMGYAGHALLRLNISVTQLALDLGYQSLGYFTNLFKKHYGMSPTEYKKMARHKK